jgi:hypothetical protein
VTPHHQAIIDACEYRRAPIVKQYLRAATQKDRDRVLVARENRVRAVEKGVDPEKLSKRDRFLGGAP